jgi:hypothetical protein
MAPALLCFACGGSTTSPPDPIDGSAGGGDAGGGVVDVAHDKTEGAVRSDAPVNWQRIGLTNGFGPCPTDSCSSSWVVTPDGHIEKTRMGDAGVARMTPTDLTELDAIVTSGPFLDGMARGFVCDQPPTDVFVSLRLERHGVAQTQGVTGCVFAGPVGNLPRRVNELLTKY